MRNMNLTPRPRDLTMLLAGGRPEPADTGRPESVGTEIPKNRKTVKPNDAEGWVKVHTGEVDGFVKAEYLGE